MSTKHYDGEERTAVEFCYPGVWICYHGHRGNFTRMDGGEDRCRTCHAPRPRFVRKEFYLPEPTSSPPPWAYFASVNIAIALGIILGALLAGR